MEQEQRVKRFISDPNTSAAVYAVLLNSFLKPKKDQDVHHLAASRIAVDLLQEGWKEMERYKTRGDDEPREAGQPGL